MAIEWKDVKSSNLKRLGYDPDQKHLHVEFVSGTKGRYDDVPRSKFDALHQASSVGTHFAAHVRSQHKWTQL